LADRCMRHGYPGNTAAGARARHARRHRSLGNIGRAAERAFDQPAGVLLVIVGGRAEPGLECLAPRAGGVAALEVEDDHWFTASGIGRRWLSAGMRERTSEIRARSISAKPTPCSPPMSSSTSPHG